MSYNIEELIKQMNGEDEIPFTDMLNRIGNSNINESTRFNYTATDLVQVINNLISKNNIIKIINS